MRIIGHLDMDAFFAAVEEREHEWLRGLPLVVGADPEDGQGRGVVSTANYKAREYGIRSAMPISEAWRRSEAARKQGMTPATFLQPNFRRYSAASASIMAIIRDYASAVEEASVDEPYFDLSPTESFSAAELLCREIKEKIRTQERLTCSIGIGPNKLIAKIASDMHKPDGLTLVKTDDAEKFLEELAIRKIPGIGPKTEAALKKNGVVLVRDLKRFSRDELHEMMGKWGSELYENIRGRDESPITQEYEVKSIGEQETFPRDTRDAALILDRLAAMCASVHNRFLHEGFQHFKTVAITVRFSDFETKSRAHTLAHKTDSPTILQFEAMKLVAPFLDSRQNPHRKQIRLIGIRIEKLSL